MYASAKKHMQLKDLPLSKDGTKPTVYTMLSCLQDSMSDFNVYSVLVFTEKLRLDDPTSAKLPTSEMLEDIANYLRNFGYTVINRIEPPPKYEQVFR
jgi:hypothetical protein